MFTPCTAADMGVHVGKTGTDMQGKVCSFPHSTASVSHALY